MFVRESSTDACLTTFLGQNKPGIDASQENRVYLQAQCARTEQELFYAQVRPAHVTLR